MNHNIAGTWQRTNTPHGGAGRGPCWYWRWCWVQEVLLLIVTVFAAVYHAEVAAHRVGEPFGTLLLAIAVTIIEVALIVSMMIKTPGSAALARDTVFAAVMIVCNGIVGLCLLVGGAHHHEQGFQVAGASAALSTQARTASCAARGVGW